MTAPLPQQLALPAAGTSALAYTLSFEAGPKLVVMPDESAAQDMTAELATFGQRAVYFPGPDYDPFAEASRDPRRGFARLSIRHQLRSGAWPDAVVTTPVALLTRWMPDADFERATMLCVAGEDVSRDRFAEHLLYCGYQPVNFVEDPGTYAIRGSIVDIFIPSESRPVRIDLFGDEIASIKTFAPESQRTFDELESIVLYPIREVIFDETTVARATRGLEALGEVQAIPTRQLRMLEEDIERRDYFFGIETLAPLFYENAQSVIHDLLPTEGGVFVARPDVLESAWDTFLEKTEKSREKAKVNLRPALPSEAHLTPAEEVWDTLAQARATAVVPLADLKDERGELPLYDLEPLRREIDLRRKAQSENLLEPVLREFQRYERQDYEIFFVARSESGAETLRELLLGRHIDLAVNKFPRGLEAPRRSPRREIVRGFLTGGFVDNARKKLFITEREIFGQAKKRSGTTKKRSGLKALDDLAAEDLVIHVDHGIGRYLGLKRLILNGVDGDYVHLEYAGGDRLYLPIYRLNLLQRYRGPKDTSVDKLGGTRWERAKQRVKDAVQSLAHELLALQAKRQAHPGRGLASPDAMFRDFEAEFPYEETPDQLKAIHDVLGDLQKDTPMDRLVCGDVGFGKTEVAMRAAFLSVLGKKQVAVLVPTTVLAEQHGHSFRERLAKYGVRVEVLSRFRSRAEAKEVLAGAEQGHVDILIGTHRILSADVRFKELGLLVVDEEQRFGVKHKERLKQLKTHVHVLTLSATPIPRTLNMAISGLRDLSIIQTAPADRVSIRTEVTRFDEELVEQAIRRELHRGGQVFVVNNRIESIARVQEIVTQLVPEARVAVGHGQMKTEQLEKIMVDFVHRRTDVLVCTAIIESGIDIPSANTMIVMRADTFGLAQLYQIRGRIGRSRDRAYAYFLLPRDTRITKDAMSRLAVLKRHSDLGSGFQIATHDLDLRGAGDLLGADQSGSIAAVGFELYSELLAEAVERARGQSAQEAVEPEIQIPVAAVFPEEYVPDPVRRIGFYQRMSQADTDQIIYDVQEEVAALYGEPPEEVANLVELMVLKRRLKLLRVEHLSATWADETIKVGVTFGPTTAVDRTALATLLQAKPERYRLLPSGRLAITAPRKEEPTGVVLLRCVREELGGLPA